MRRSGLLRRSPRGALPTRLNDRAWQHDVVERLLRTLERDRQRDRCPPGVKVVGDPERGPLAGHVSVHELGGSDDCGWETKKDSEQSAPSPFLKFDPHHPQRDAEELPDQDLNLDKQNQNLLC